MKYTVLLAPTAMISLVLSASPPAATMPLGTSSVTAAQDGEDLLARRRKKPRKKKKKAPEPVPEPAPAPPPPPPPPKGPRVLVFPPVTDGADAALAAAVRAATLAEVKALHGAEKLHFEGGEEKVAAVEKALGSLLASCQSQTSCLVEQGQGAEAAFVLSVSVANAATGHNISVTLVDVAQASLDASYARRVGPEADVGQEVSATVRLAMRRFLDAGPGTLTLVVTEPGATVRVDSGVRGTSPMDAIEVGSGPHLVQVEKDGWFTFDAVAEVPRGGDRNLEVVLEPTPELLEAQAFGRTLWAALAWSTIGVGTLTALGGGGLVGYNALRAGEVSQAISDANEQYETTGVPDDVAADLQGQKDEVNLLTGVGGGIIGLGVVIAATGVVLLFLGE